MDQFLLKKEELCFRLADIDAQFMNHFLENCNGDCTKVNDETILKGNCFAMLVIIPQDLAILLQTAEEQWYLVDQRCIVLHQFFLY